MTTNTRSSRFIGNWKDHVGNALEEIVNNNIVGTWSTGAPNLTIVSGLTVSAGSVTVPAGTIGAADIADDSLIGDQVADVANVNTEGGIPLIYRINIAAVGATSLSADTNVTVVDKIRVLDVMVVKQAGTTAGGNENVTIKNSGTAITDVMSWTGANNSIVRAATIDDAQHEISAAGTLRVTIDTSITDETSDAGVAYITAIKVA